jgi:hypothetical protein
MDCHNQCRNNQDRNKDREQKEETKLSHLTMPSQELTPSSGSHPPLCFPACNLKRGDEEFEKNYFVDTSKHTRQGKRGV